MGNLCDKEKINLDGRTYTVKEHLEYGGFSSIDLVEDSKTHKSYVLKRISSYSIMDLEIAEAEIGFYRKFDHPNILKCIASRTNDMPESRGCSVKETLMLLPYYSRGTLCKELLRRFSKKDYICESQVLDIFYKICLGIQAMHSANPYALAHRDIKTANILLADDFNPVVIDLGSTQKARIHITNDVEARQLQDHAAERSSMPYRAPELFHVESNCYIDERTDIWSLGCLLYALCFFKSPYDFVYERGDSVALAVVSGNIHFPDSHPYSLDVVGLIRSLLKINMEDRPFIDDILEKTKTLLQHKRSEGVV